MTRRLILSYLAVALVVLVVLELPLAIFYRSRETSRLSAEVERDAAALASYYQAALERGQTPDAGYATRYTRRTDTRAVVVGPSGVSLVDTAGRTGRDFSTRPEFGSALRGNAVTGTRHSATLGTDLLYAAVPIASGGHVYGAVRITLDTAAVMTLVHRFWFGLIAIAAVVLAAVAAIGWAIARSVDRPLRTLHASAVRFAEGDFRTYDSDDKAPPEIAELQATMNRMARRLDQLISEQRAFVADASHQLRTPLTALRLRLENLESELGPPQLADDCQAGLDLDAAVAETDRLSALVDDLLRLARAEEPAPTVTVDLVRAATDRVDTWSAIADARDLRIELDLPAGPVKVAAVSTGVEQILDNLLDNAIAASPQGSRIVVTVAAASLDWRDPASGSRLARHTPVAAGRLSVADEGRGMTHEQKGQALERFWRLDHSTPGTGLGLPIARALAEASGGDISLEDARSGGLVVTVTLPSSDREDSYPGPAFPKADVTGRGLS